MLQDTLGNITLVHHIQQLIENSPDNAIPFEKFMEECLYAPEYGYYTNDRVKIGKEGDFYTSSNIGTIMGEVIARYIIKQWEQSSAKLIPIVEWGGGTGRLALHVLDAWKQNNPEWYERIIYTMVEQSPHHREIQKETLRNHESRVTFVTPDQWLTDKNFHEGVLLSNELLDAFPVHRIKLMNGILHKLYVTWDESEKRFAEQYVPLDGDDSLMEQIRRRSIRLQEGQIADIHVASIEWLGKIVSKMKSGVIITIDYGYTSEELYSANRRNGTLMCYYRHHAHDNPYIWIGEQDITSHVDFTACMEAGNSFGFQSKLLSQRDFLLEHGVLDLLQEHDGLDPFSEAARKNRAIQQLVIGNGMGEQFKVLLQTKQ